jgi:effector-binding domain-containing protein
MKKKVLFFVLSIGIAFLLYACLVNTVTKKEILINAPVIRVQHQLSAIKSISRWYLPFAGTDTAAIKITENNKLEANSNSLLITSLTGLRAAYQVSENGATKNFLFDVFADTAGQSKVTLIYETNLWNRLTGNNTVTANAIKSLQHLKEYFEDTKKMYGFEMEVVELTDTAFLFTSKVVANSAKKAAFKSLYESLIQYAAEKDMGFNGTKIFYTSPFGNDSIHIFTSIGISNPKNASLSGEYSLKKMPYKGRLLSAYYQGSFKNINSVIRAMEQFKSDNGMTSMAIPFIKPITEGIDFDDAQIIQARAYYPVY